LTALYLIYHIMLPAYLSDILQEAEAVNLYCFPGYKNL